MTESEARALLELFACVDTVFEEAPAFALKHECPASKALGRIFRTYKLVRAELEEETPVIGRGTG